MEKNDFQNVEFEQNTLKSAKCYYFFAKGFTCRCRISGGSENLEIGGLISLGLIRAENAKIAYGVHERRSPKKMSRFTSVQKYDQDTVLYFSKMRTDRRYLHFTFGGQGPAPGYF